jgi:hypothetical protein
MTLAKRQRQIHAFANGGTAFFNYERLASISAYTNAFEEE